MTGILLFTARSPPTEESLFGLPPSHKSTPRMQCHHMETRSRTARQPFALPSLTTQRKLKTNHDTFSIDYHWSFWRRLADPRK